MGLRRPAHDGTRRDVVKLALLRFRPDLGYRVAPWIGRYAVVAFIGIWVTSPCAYFTNTL